MVLHDPQGQPALMLPSVSATLSWWSVLAGATSPRLRGRRERAFTVVGGLMAALLMSIFLLPTMYVWIAGEHDVLPAPEGEFE